MNKLIIIIITLITLAVSGLAIQRTRAKVQNARYTIGILQTASHPALDACKNALIQELKNVLGDEAVAFELYNAQGSIIQAHALAQRLHANKDINLYYAIATPAAQALSTVEKERPIIIAAVTDPQVLGSASLQNICGITDMIDIKAEIEMLKTLVPEAKTVGIIYTSGEANSIAMVQHMHELINAKNMKAIDFAVTSEADIPAVIELACRKTDVLLAPADNTIASAMSLIATIARKCKTPLIASHQEAVPQGALAACGVDYHLCGKRAAEIALELLKGNTVAALPIESPQSTQAIINKTTADILEIAIPEHMQKQIVIID